MQKKKKQEQSRHVSIVHADLEEFGYAASCPACDVRLSRRSTRIHGRVQRNEMTFFRSDTHAA